MVCEERSNEQAISILKHLALPLIETSLAQVFVLAAVLNYSKGNTSRGLPVNDYKIPPVTSCTQLPSPLPPPLLLHLATSPCGRQKIWLLVELCLLGRSLITVVMSVPVNVFSLDLHESQSPFLACMTSLTPLSLFFPLFLLSRNIAFDQYTSPPLPSTTRHVCMFVWGGVGWEVSVCVCEMCTRSYACEGFINSAKGSSRGQTHELAVKVLACTLLHVHGC